MKILKFFSMVNSFFALNLSNKPGFATKMLELTLQNPKVIWLFLEQSKLFQGLFQTSFVNFRSFDCHKSCHCCSKHVLINPWVIYFSPFLPNNNPLLVFWAIYQENILPDFQELLLWWFLNLLTNWFSKNSHANFLKVE